MLSNKRLVAFDLQVSFVYSIQQNSQLMLSNTASNSQVSFICPIQQNLKHTLSYKISAASGLQVCFTYPIEQSSEPMLNDEILPTFNSQVLFDEQKVSSVYSIDALSESETLNTNDVENEFINNNIFDINKHHNIEVKD
ncbi:6329_t:CDS:2 [Gigaspora rosea]|nr:6329_t:CDS:2 [Gigaspora rosea]